MNLLQPSIVFNTINVNVQKTNGAVMIGENVANSWETIDKTQMSIGKFSNSFLASSAAQKNINIFCDQDIIDTLISVQSIESFEPVKQG
jgi:hypothetical protein